MISFYIMILIFCGDLQFGRNKNKSCSIKLSKNILDLFNSSTAIFFNLETVLLNNNFNKSKFKLQNKDIHIYNDKENSIKYLQNVIKPPIFISTINNHTFDFGEEGYQDTLKILDKYNYKFTVKKTYYIDNNIIYLNATDHWTIVNNNNINYPENSNLWDNNCLLINNLEKELYTYKLISYLNKIKGNRKIIFSIHWGRNYINSNNTDTYLYDKYKTFFKNLGDLGADIIFGHGAHHIMNPPYELYNGKLIIYGLGDFTGDFKYKNSYNTDKSLILRFNTENKSINSIVAGGEYDNYNCKNPIIL